VKLNSRHIIEKTKSDKLERECEMAFVVVLDACVLFPASLRDTLLRAAQADLYRLQLTEEILEEVRRNLVKKTMTEYRAQRLISTLRENFQDSMISQHRQLIPSMPTNEKDRHVLAAAVACRAQVIVTFNLRDFPADLLAPFEVEAQSPDVFLTHLHHLDAQSMPRIIVEQASNLYNPPRSVDDVLKTLEQHAPIFVSLMRNSPGLRQ
jgi:predicted nucleic acid-binding protein